jgi:hypothetical protein
VLAVVAVTPQLLAVPAVPAPVSPFLSP